MSAALDEDDALVDQLDGRGAGRHLDPHRVVEDACASWAMSGGMVAENSSDWRCFGSSGDDVPDVADEAHVEHPVGLVEDEGLDARRAGHAPARSGRGAAPASRPGYRRPRAIASTCGALADAAEDDGRAQPEMAAVGAEAVADLQGELARRGQHQAARGLRRAPAAPAGGDRPRDAAGSAARRPRSCRCRSGRCRAGRGRRADAGSPGPGSGSAWRSLPRRARGKSARRVPGLEIQSRILILSGSTAGQGMACAQSCGCGVPAMSGDDEDVLRGGFLWFCRGSKLLPSNGRRRSTPRRARCSGKADAPSPISKSTRAGCLGRLLRARAVVAPPAGMRQAAAPWGRAAAGSPHQISRYVHLDRTRSKMTTGPGPIIRRRR